MEIKVIQDIEAAQSAWRALSPNESLYDLWEIRQTFYQNDVQPLHFLAAYEGGELVGLLPLQYNRRDEVYEMMAENMAFDNRPFVKAGYEYLIPELFAAAPATTKIFDILGTHEYIRNLPLEDYVYTLDISRFSSFADYLQASFPSAHKRSNFKRQFTVLERDHQVEVIHGDFADLELIMDLNIKHFKEESYFSTERERQAFRDLIKLPLDWQLVTVKVDGKKLAASLSVIYQDTYYYMIVGSDISEVSDVFKYLTKANLDLAISRRLKTFNFALGSCNWKEFWHLEKIPQYEFIKEKKGA